MARFVVGTVDEIPPGGRKIVEIAGRSIGVFNVNGEFFALLNRCPHQAGPLCKGNAHGFLRSGGVGEYQYSRPGEIVRCPWHGWEFDVRTGQSWFDPAQVRVRRYDVTVARGAELLADAPAPQSGPAVPTADLAGTLPAAGSSPDPGAAGGVTAPPPPDPGTTPAEVAAATPPGAGATEPGMEGLLKGPYVAETFPVTVEASYLVVEIGR